MGIFDFFKHSDINQGVQEYKNAVGAVLLDVRTHQEYREGHIPGSQNVPLQQLDKGGKVTENKGTALHNRLQKNGGITACQGKVEEL